METKNFYATPEMKVLEFQTEGVLCSSDRTVTGNGIEDYDVISW